MATSGILLNEMDDGSISVGYVDYNVEFFGGRDYESFYRLDKENADKLRAYLKGKGYRDLKEGLIIEVGKNFSDSKFCELCKKENIVYQYTSWS